MWRCLVQFAIIFQLFQCIQGVLRPFNTHQHKEDIELFRESLNALFRSDINSDRDVNIPAKPALRTHRQNTGGNPEYSAYNYLGDSNQYARVSYLGEGSKVIFLLTYNISSSFSHVTSSSLYRSTDYGQSFQWQFTKLPLGFRLHNVIYRFPNSKTVMFADNTRSAIYVTTDEGETFRSYNIPVNPRTLKVHPTMSGWILGHDSIQGVLMYSENSGASWGIVARNVHPQYYSDYITYDFIWGEPGIDWHIKNPSLSDVTKVFYTVHNVTTTSSNNRIIHVAQNCGSGYTNKVFDPNLGYAFNFIMDGNFIFVAKYKHTYDDEVELYVSYMRNPFNLTRIPTMFSHYHFYVTSHRSSQALVIIEHNTHYSLYLSDETGTYYSLSLEDIVVQVKQYGYFTIDLQIINSINGTMMANQFVGQVNGSQRNQTLITFDNGAQWHKIEAPTLQCVLPTCSLHFHMGSSTDYRHMAVYSRDSAPGLIVAHGNTGSYLTDTGSVYITRDGGLTWEQTLYYTRHFEIIDHGGLLVAVGDNHQNYIRTIMYSCDEGMSWRNFNLINIPIVMQGIVTEPGETTTQVLLFGTSLQNSWVVILVNFTSIFLRTCETSDYENWTVSDGRVGDQQCLLGETRIIERRKPSVCCWNSRQYERVISTTPCECTAADFECEWGYYSDDDSENCTLNLLYGPNLDCLTGYRKIAGDVCFGGVSAEYLPPDDCALDNEVKSITSNVCEDDSMESNNNAAGGAKKTDHDSSTITIFVSVIAAVIIIATVAMIIMITFLIVRKRKKCLSVAAPTDHDVSANVLPNIYEASPAQVTMQDHAVIEETFLVHTNF